MMKTSEMAKLSTTEQREIIDPTPKNINDFLTNKDTDLHGFADRYYTVNDGKTRYNINQLIKALPRLKHMSLSIYVHYKTNGYCIAEYNGQKWFI